MPTIAGTRMPFLPCLETPNKATMPETKPTAMSKSATSTIIGIIFRATICLSNIKSAKTMRLMTGQTQPSLAARCENDVVFGVVGVSIFGCGLTLLLSVYACTTLCTVGFCKPGCYHALIKADLRIFIKDYRQADAQCEDWSVLRASVALARFACASASVFSTSPGIA